VVLLLGETHEDLGGTEYLKRVHGKVTGRPPALDLSFEKKVQAVCLEAIRAGLVASAHDCSSGGLAVALAECCMLGSPRRLGAQVSLPESESGVRMDARLFGESPSRIVMSATTANAERIRELATREGVPAQVLGAVGGDGLKIGAGGMTQIALGVSEMERIWRGAIAAIMEQ
jgi:phosphoribosylformylglycinamidine synthase